MTGKSKPIAQAIDERHVEHEAQGAALGGFRHQVGIALAYGLDAARIEVGQGIQEGPAGGDLG